jgi:copper chaperone CopZ
MNQQRELVIDVHGMTCDHCERTVSNALRSVRGVQDVLAVSHASALARVAAGPEVTAERDECYERRYELLPLHLLPGLGRGWSQMDSPPRGHVRAHPGPGH